MENMREKRDKSPELLFPLVEMCEKSEVSELSPVRGWHFPKTGTSFCTSDAMANVPSSQPAPSSVALGWPRAGVRWCVFPKLSKLLIQEDAWACPCSMV